MSTAVCEKGQVYLTANANLQCFVGQGELIGVFVASASNTPLLTIQDCNGNLNGANVAADYVNGNMNQTVAPQFVPVSATFYRLPAKLLQGCRIEMSGNIVCTVFANKG